MTLELDCTHWSAASLFLVLLWLALAFAFVAAAAAKIFSNPLLSPNVVIYSFPSFRSL